MDVLNPHFPDIGAFLTDYETGEILFGEGGHINEVREISLDVEAFYLKDFYEDKYLQYIPEEWHRLSKVQFQALFSFAGETKFEAVGNDDHFYAEDFTRLKSQMGKNLQKVVLLSREEFQTSDSISARVQLISKALAFGTGLSYGLWNRKYGVIGSTPELLYHLKEKDLYTFALAGTSKTGQEQELLSSQKDRYEHDLVILDIMEKLSTFCQDLSSEETGIAQFKSLIHLKTNVAGKLKPKTDISGIVSTLSPTAALGGYPKKQGIQFLKSTTYFNRHPGRFFGSAMGVVKKDLHQFIVTIRNVQWEGEKFIIESGGGVVPTSVLENELNEIALKRAIIRENFL